MEQLDWQGWGALQQRPAWWRRLRHKRWHYVGLHGDPFFIGLAVVDVGWCATAFAYAFDRQAAAAGQGGLLADVRSDALPGRACIAPRVGGAGSRLTTRGGSWTLDPVAGGLHVRVDTRALQLEATIGLDGTAPWLLAVGEPAGGPAHATQKSPALPAHGWLRAGGRHATLNSAHACIDSSSGFLGRTTAWRWACAQSAGLGFNLQQGYFGEQENALWLDGRLIPLGAAQFDFDPRQPLAPWRIRTSDGLLDLVFTPEGGRHEDRNLLLAASHYVQPVGRFNGTVRAHGGAPARAVRDLVGVTEDHRSRW
ncbi:MAG: DUF2804 domain-containing protein [Burkholderiales bacterium]|nr:DUF2804 domain-containing protein [Burkholderiales bacterium]